MIVKFFFFTDNFSRSKFSTFKYIFPTTKGKFEADVKTLSRFVMVEGLGAFFLEYERPLPFLGDEVDGGRYLAVIVRFLFFNAGADDSVIPEVNNDDLN
jgi:hypothetical protein